VLLLAQFGGSLGPLAASPIFMAGGGALDSSLHVLSLG
jgi:hypothetical protein